MTPIILLFGSFFLVHCLWLNLHFYFIFFYSNQVLLVPHPQTYDVINSKKKP